MTIQNIIYDRTGVMVGNNEMRSLITSADAGKLKGLGLCCAFPATQ